MKTTIEDVSGVKKRLKVEVDADVAAEAKILAVRELQKSAKVEGFRPGKVPSNIIEQRFAHEVQHQMIDKAVDLTLAEAIRQTNLRPISRPEIDPGLSTATGGFSYTATFDVLPEIVIKEKDYKGLKLEKTEVKVENEEMEAELKRLQQAMTQLEPTSTETVMAAGHVVTIDFKGLIEGKEYKEGEAKDFHVEVGTGSLLPEFEKAIAGLKAGEEREVKFDYPQDYFNKDLAGKKAEFKIKVKAIRKKNVPALDDEFAKDLGAFKTLKDVKEDLSKRIAAAKESQAKGLLFNEILKQLVDKTKFDVPESLVHSELGNMIQELAEEMKKRGQKVEDLNPEELIKHYKPEAEFRVRAFLVLDRVAEESKMAVSDKELEERLQAIAKGINRSFDEVKAHYEKNKLISSLKTRILHEKTLEFVLNESKIKVVKPKKEKK